MKCEIFLQQLLVKLLEWTVCMQLKASSLFAPLLTCTLKAVKNMVAMVSALSPASAPCCSASFPSAAFWKPPLLFSRCSALAWNVESQAPAALFCSHVCLGLFFFHCQFLKADLRDFACLRIYSPGSWGPRWIFPLIIVEKGSVETRHGSIFCSVTSGWQRCLCSEARNLLTKPASVLPGHV